MCRVYLSNSSLLVALASSFPYLPEYMRALAVDPNEVAVWTGALTAAFTLSEALVAIPWSMFADRFGCTSAIVAGQIISMAGNIGFGFCRSLPPIIFLVLIGGAGNGTIGVLRTMVVELCPKNDDIPPRMLSILPTAAALGTLLGPVVGGSLAQPAVRYPKAFAQDGIFAQYPFALPNLLSALVFLPGLILVILVAKASCSSLSIVQSSADI